MEPTDEFDFERCGEEDNNREHDCYPEAHGDSSPSQISDSLDGGMIDVDENGEELNKADFFADINVAQIDEEFIDWDTFLGFCVICEKEAYIFVHMLEEHGSGDPFEPNAHYEVVDFEGTKAMVPIGTRLEKCSELAKCPTCSGVFYKHRVCNHACGNLSFRFIDEGNGPQFCLMCQLRCEDAEIHNAIAHFNNEIYVLVPIETPGKLTWTLMPEKTNAFQELVFYEDCPCQNTCLPFTYKNRVKKTCPFQNQL